MSVSSASKWICGNLVNVLIFKKPLMLWSIWLCLLNFIVLLLIRQGLCGFHLSNKSLLVDWIAWNYCKLQCLSANWWSFWSPGWKVLFFSNINDLLNPVLLLVLVLITVIKNMSIRLCHWVYRMSLQWFKQQTYLSQKDTVVEVIKMPIHAYMV